MEGASNYECYEQDWARLQRPTADKMSIRFVILVHFSGKRANFSYQYIKSGTITFCSKYQDINGRHDKIVSVPGLRITDGANVRSSHQWEFLY